MTNLAFITGGISSLQFTREKTVSFKSGLSWTSPRNYFFSQIVFSFSDWLLVMFHDSEGAPGGPRVAVDIFVPGSFLSFAILEM